MNVNKIMSGIVALMLALGGGAQIGLGQTVTLDEGVFRVLVGGQEVGMETFSIKRTGSGDGAVTIAQGRVVLDRDGAGEEVATALEVSGPALRPAAYQVTVRGDEQQKIFGRLVGGRFRAQILSSAGEQMREYLAGEGALVLDDGVAHHYYFLALRPDVQEFRVPIIVPRQSRQLTTQVTSRGMESVQVAGQAVQARHLVVQPSEGPTRHVWADDRGRILRVEVPDRNYAAVRTTLP